MTWTDLPRRQRAVVLSVGFVALYGVAAMLWFNGRSAAWERSRRAYERAAKQTMREKKLISQRETWRERAETESLKMPVVGEDESTQTRWQRLLEKIAAENSVAITSEQPKPEEDHGSVWEMPIEVKYDAALGKLVAFLYALNVAEGVMLDVRDLDVTAKNNGWLSGKFTLTCAYMKKSGAPDASKASNKKGSR